MSWQNEWKALSGRVQGLLEAGRFAIAAANVNSRLVSKFAKYPYYHAVDVFEEIKAFASKNGTELPELARQELAKFIRKRQATFDNKSEDTFNRICILLTILADFKDTFEYILTDFAAFALRGTMRAFVHLQRSIVADKNVGANWRSAHDLHEMACERLGGAHLLLHGIWAFKVAAEGERTDLVLGTPMHETQDVAEVADALVLTEWKLLREKDGVEAKFLEARHQAQRYGKGVLGGIELHSYRFLILVSSRAVICPSDEIDGQITYRYINIAVNPDTPSAGARRTRIATL